MSAGQIVTKTAILTALPRESRHGGLINERAREIYRVLTQTKGRIDQPTLRIFMTEVQAMRQAWSKERERRRKYLADQRWKGHNQEE